MFFAARPALRPLVAGALAVALVASLAACSGDAGGSSDGSGSTGSGSTDTGATGSDSTDTAPAVEALSAADGSVTGGSTITLTGSGLDGVTAVSFGANAASAVTAVSDEELTVTTPAAVNYATGPVDVSLAEGDAAAVASGLTYNYTVVTPVDAQMNYLLTYWQNRNEAEYGSYGDNDCVNFTSQSLIARGWVEDDEWYHEASSTGEHSYSSPWLSSTSMMKYFTARPELATALTDQQRDQVVIGDIVQFDWDNSGDRDHTGVVTRIEGSGPDRVIFFAGHSLDSDFRSVDVAITTDHPGGTAYYWHLQK
ncbi:IPT/TIG domain-containing protein [Glaciihabitans tibetensis]|uniref:IPT/TIG domain-containing protein n=1 Tax=Glaciihabitans tibetensis TaxID=1266600 RepID=A0A2T0V9U5_9MICO|nr:amidase domain-containing protein [Glaciihabitans tibetensis]PRY66952.1 IPT/TIG domain-containing protein [Glaciihabitans tibetensis]